MLAAIKQVPHKITLMHMIFYISHSLSLGLSLTRWSISAIMI